MPEPVRADRPGDQPPAFLDADELPRDRVDELAMWLYDRNIGICEMDDDIVYNDLKSVRQLAEALLQHGPEGIRIAPPISDRSGDREVDVLRRALASVSEVLVAKDELIAQLRWLHAEAAFQRDCYFHTLAYVVTRMGLDESAVDDAGLVGETLRERLREGERARSALKEARVESDRRLGAVLAATYRKESRGLFNVAESYQRVGKPEIANVLLAQSAHFHDQAERLDPRGIPAPLVADEVGHPAAQEAAPCPCGGRRWVEDKNWSPEYPELWRGERSPGDGLIPCGFCNEGGWDVEPVERAAAQEAADPSEPSLGFRQGWKAAMEEIDAWAERQAERAREHDDQPGEQAYRWCSTAALVRRNDPTMPGRLANRVDVHASAAAQEAGEPPAMDEALRQQLHEDHLSDCDGSYECQAMAHVEGCLVNDTFMIDAHLPEVPSGGPDAG
jgi:hypothetical protein